MKRLLALFILSLLLNPVAKADAMGGQAMDFPPLVAPADAVAATDIYKNVQLLSHLKLEKFKQVMKSFAGDLGVSCNFCHDSEDFSLDIKPEKKHARVMIRMVQYLNGEYFKEQRMSCFSCHAGHEEPVALPASVKELPPSLNGTGKDRKLSADHSNIKKLGHLSDDDFDRLMVFFTQAVGAQTERCGYCHSFFSYASDSKEPKHKARKMIDLVNDLNKRFVDDEELNCYTCHHGEKEPVFRPVSEK